MHDPGRHWTKSFVAKSVRLTFQQSQAIRDLTLSIERSPSPFRSKNPDDSGSRFWSRLHLWPSLVAMIVTVSCSAGSLAQESVVRSKFTRDRSLVSGVSRLGERAGVTASTSSKEVKTIVQTSQADDSAAQQFDEDVASGDLAFETSSSLATLQALETTPIDLAGAFALIGVQNPQFLAAQQRVLEAVALRQLAAVQLLPTINLGTNLDSHRGTLQQSDGNILTVHRDALFVGAGANAVAAGSVNIPGIVWNLNISDTYYNYLISRQVQTQKLAHVNTVNNEIQLRVAIAYLELVQAASQRSIAWQSREEVAQVARLTAAYARAGQGRLSDADRAASELSIRDAIVIEAEGQSVRASARLAALIGLDTAVTLLPTDRWAVPHSIVPEPIPLPELLTIAALQRPELQEQRAEFSRALLTLDAAEMLPFSPNVFLGFSAGSFGGGSDLASQPTGSGTFARGQDRFGNFQSRTDLDVVVYWTLRNLGVGNKAQVAASASRVRQSQWQQLIVLDRIRAEVAAAHVRVHARCHRLTTAEEAVREAEIAWREDVERIRGNEGLPIEVLDSQRLLNRSRVTLLDTIIKYNIAQFELYQSLGHPRAELLIRSADEIEILDVPAPSPTER
jgi:outer membrane protein TolC